MNAVRNYWQNAERVINQAIIGFTTEARPKDAYCNLMEALFDVEAATGYDAEFLCDIIMDGLEDGETETDAIRSVITIAYEKDF